MFFHGKIFTCYVIGQDIGLISDSRPSFVVQGKYFGVKFTNLVKLAFKSWTLYGVDREKQTRILGIRHRWNVETSQWLTVTVGLALVCSVSIPLLIYFSSRICIMNDELIVRNASPREIQNAFIPATPPLSEEQQEMVKSFSMQSRMKLTWAQKWVLGVQRNWWSGVGDQVNNGTCRQFQK